MAQGDYNGSIEWRMSRLSMVDTQFGGALRPTSKQLQHSYEADGEQLIDMEHALMPPILKIDYSMADIDATQSGDVDSSNGTLVPSIDSTTLSGDEGMQNRIPVYIRLLITCTQITTRHKDWTGFQK